MAEEIQQKAEESTEAPEGEENNEGAEPEEGSEPEEGKKEEVLPAEGYEPEVRKTFSSREEREAFFKAKKEEQKGEEGEESDEDKMFGRLSQKLGSFLDERLGKVSDKQDEIFVGTEVNSFLSNPNNAHFKKYEARARKYLSTHKSVSVPDAFKTLAFDDAMVLGAERSKDVEAKAKKNRISGNSKRDVGSKTPNFSDRKTLDETNRRIRMGEKVEVS